MSGYFAAFCSALGGAAVGSLLTWILATRGERNRARRDILIRLAQRLQDYRVAYAMWYVEYLSPSAQEVGGHWSRLNLVGRLDPTYVTMMQRVDELRGELRVFQGVLYAHFPQHAIKPLWAQVDKVLVISSGNVKADCGKVDQVVEGAWKLIPDLIQRYL